MSGDIELTQNFCAILLFSINNYRVILSTGTAWPTKQIGVLGHSEEPSKLGAKAAVLL
jgi:hypothetical protein